MEQLSQEPFVDSCECPDVFDGSTSVEGVGDRKDTFIGGILELFVDILVVIVLRANESVAGDETEERMADLSETSKRRIDSPNSFLHRLLECLSNRHDFSNTLHTTAQKSRHPLELLEIPSRNLDDDVIQTRLEAGGSVLGDRVLDLVERNVESELGGDESERVSSGF